MADPSGPSPSGRPPFDGKPWVAIGCQFARASDALHKHAMNTLPKRLRALRHLEAKLAKVHAPGKGLGGGLAGVGDKHHPLLPRLPPLGPAAVQGAVAFAAGLLVTGSVHILQQLQQAHHALHHGSDGAAEGSLGHTAAKAPWRKLLRGRFQPNRSESMPRSATAMHAKAEELQRQCDPHAAIAYLEEAVKLNPKSVELLVLLSKQWSDCSFLDDWPANERVPANQKAQHYSKQAIDTEPKNAMGYVASCMSKGRLAYWSKDNKQKIHLAKEAQDEVCQALTLDPKNDLAHHLMGRWHFEMAQLNFVVRGLVRVLYGTNFMAGSVAEALESYRTAAALRPDRLVHHVEVGRMHSKLGNDAEAVAALQTALSLPIEDLNSRINKEEAAKMLATAKRRLQKQQRRQKSSKQKGGSDGAAVAQVAMHHGLKLNMLPVMSLAVPLPADSSPTDPAAA